MKQFYRLPFELNADIVKQLHYEYIQMSYTMLPLVLYSSVFCCILTALCLFILSYNKCFALSVSESSGTKAAAEHQDFVYFVEVGFNLAKTRLGKKHHRTPRHRNWFIDYPQVLMLNLQPNSPFPFLNPLELFSTYDRKPHQRKPLLQAMEDACGKGAYATPEATSSAI
jgi:hypothetical protein